MNARETLLNAAEHVALTSDDREAFDLLVDLADAAEDPSRPCPDCGRPAGHGRTLDCIG